MAGEASRGLLYVETSVWSAVIDPRIPGRQRLTRRFLRAAGRRCRLLVSDLALGELDEHPNAELRRRILRYLRKKRPRVLGPSAGVRRTTEELMAQGGWTRKALADVSQLGYAVCAGATAFVTWNQKHLARDEVRTVVRAVCRKRGIPPLQVGTPREVATWLGLKTWR